MLKGGGRLADIAFAREEHEHVVLLGEFGYGGGDVARKVKLVVLAGRTIHDFDGEEPAWNGDDRCAAEEVREMGHVEGR